MMSKNLILSNALKKSALETITELADIVKTTLGPGGNPIIIQRQGKAPDGTALGPLITKDGVTVAENALPLADPIKNTVAQAVLQVARNTVEEAGDGTTSAIVLAEAIYRHGYHLIEQGRNSIRLYNDLRKVKEEILRYIDNHKQEITVDRIREVATISANGDEEIASIVTEAIQAVGEDGHISLEEGFSHQTTLKIVEGAMYKQGWRNFGANGSLFITDKTKNAAVLAEPSLLLYAGKIESYTELAPLVEQHFLEKGDDGKDYRKSDEKPLVIVAHDFSDEVKDFLTQNKAVANLPFAAIKTPVDGSPNSRTQILEDIAAMTGGTVLARGIIPLHQIKAHLHLGVAQRVEVGMNETVIFGGQGREEVILERLEDLKSLLEQTPHEFDKQNLRLRIGKLTGGIAVIKVGGSSELEIGEKKDRIEDALCAAKVAISDGIVPGGGTVLANWAKIQTDNTSDAMNIMKKAAMEPFNQIVRNAGDNPEIIDMKRKNPTMGYDASNKKMVKDLIKAGIIDPTKVTKAVVENAISIAGLLLTTGGAITIKEEKIEPINPMSLL